jgi:dephospho-CoA kinase
MILIGLTGGIASGKSTVSNMFRKMDIPVIDADEVSRNVVQTGSKVLDAISLEFGKGVITASGELNRKALGAIVFGDEKKLNILNSIIQPAIRLRIIDEIGKLKDKTKGICVVDIPLLYEFSYEDMVDYIIVVYVNYENEIERLVKRDKITREDAIKRIESQMSLNEKIKKADFIIDNNGSTENTYRQFREIINKINNLEDING